MGADPETVFHAALNALSDTKADYFLYGGLAAGLWGVPRYTEDVDLVVFLPERELPHLLRNMTRHGFHADETLYVQQVQISGWTRIPYGGRESPWHIDVTLGDSPFDQSALARRREVTFFGRPVFVASPEDLILYKAVSGTTSPERLHDWADVHSICRRMGKDLDAAYLRHWAAFWEGEGIYGIAAKIEDGLTPPV